MNIKACSALLIVIVALATPSLAKPSAFEADSSGKDLQELEAMLAGEHRGAEYVQNVLPISPSSVGALYDPPFKNAFLNDTFFGDFLRELSGGPSTSRANLTWPETLFAGLPDQNTSAIAKPAGASRHFIKPILIKEPDF